MSCIFSIPYNGNSKLLVKKIEKDITENGGAFSGNDKKGEIEIDTPLGKVKGTYEIKVKEIVITITKKPLVLSCKKIKDNLSGYI